MADEAPLTVVKSEPLPTLSVVDDQPAAPQPSGAMQQFWARHPNAAQLTKGALNSLPTAGAITGGVIATPETLGAGTVVGSALGAGAGRGARDLLAEALGLEDKTSPLSKGARIALDTAITAATPAVAGTAKRLLTDPRTTLADLLDVFAHPQSTVDKVVDYLRATAPSAQAVPSISEGFTLPQAKPVKLPDGTWGMASVNAGETIAPGTTVNVNTSSGKTFTAAMPQPFDPQADIRAAQVYINGGMSPSQAAIKAAGGSAARAAKIMSYFMNASGVK